MQSTNNYSKLAKKLKSKKAEIAIVGLGYVGLPLAVEFAGKGFRVTGIEIDNDRLRHIKRGESYITDITNAQLKKVMAAGKFTTFQEFSALKQADVIIICVPTPLKRKYHPDISYIKQAVKAISENMKKGTLVVLESTTYPGTTEEVILPLLERSGLKHAKDFYLSFSPERIDPNNRKYPVNKIPKIVGGVTRAATRLAAMAYANIIDKVVEVSSARVAEAAKLLENTFRLINIAMIDELTMMAHKMNIDIWEVIRAAATKPFGFMPFYPGPGVGGHCIPKDPLYLYWKAKHYGFRSRFIKLASDVVNHMPEYVVERVIEELKKRVKKEGGRRTKVLVVGVTYKKDVKDLRKSPSIDIIDIFKKKGISASYYDPLIPFLKFNGIDLESIALNKKSVQGFDCTLIATNHTQVDYGFILKNSKIVFDTRNVYQGKVNGKVVKL